MLPAEVLRNCQSWTEFQSRVTALSDKQKGDAFELLVAFALRLHPLYKTKLEKVWHHSDVPSDVREHLQLPSKDKGIDIVARTFDATTGRFRRSIVPTLPRRSRSTNSRPSLR